MILIDEDDVVNGEVYFVVCDDGVLRYLTAEFRMIGIDNDVEFKEYVFYNVDGREQYRTYSPEKIFKL